MVTTRYSDQQGSKSRQKVMRLYKRWHRPISKRFIKPPYSIREQPRSTRNVVAYPRPAFSAKNRKNYAPTSFDQQVVQNTRTVFCKKATVGLSGHHITLFLERISAGGSFRAPTGCSFFAQVMKFTWCATSLNSLTRRNKLR